MIRFNAKLGNGEKVSLECPTSWEEVKFGQMIEIGKQKETLNPIFLFSILTGVEFEGLANSKDEKLMSTLEEASNFIYDEPDWGKIKPPNELLIGGERYPLPKDLNDITWGQRILLKQLSGKDNLDEALAEAIAIMMIPEIYGEFKKETESKIPDLIEKVNQSNALQMYGAGQFFFLHSDLLRSIGQSFMIKYRNQRTKRKELIS